MQITGRTTPGNETALFMETSGVVIDRLILNLPGYGPESWRSLSFCLSVWFLYFLSFLSICFFPFSFSCSLSGVVHLSRSILCLCFLSVFASPASHCVWVFSLFCLSTSCSVFHLLWCQTSNRQRSDCQRDDEVCGRSIAQHLPAMRSAPHAHTTRPARHMHL